MFTSWIGERIGFYIAYWKKDRRIWIGTVDGSFSVVSFFEALRGDRVWNSKAPNEVLAFSWLVISGAILTMDNLHKHNIIIVNDFPMCLRDAESVDC